MLRPEALRRPQALPIPDGRAQVGRLLIAAVAGVRHLAHASGGTRTFASAFLFYVAAAVLLVFALGSVALDAWSRVANASYVLFSRDPHLGAIGFVWNPLPSLLVLPLLPLRSLWPELVSQGFVTNLVSCAAMAVAVVQVRGFLIDAHVARPLRLSLTVLFAVHPLLVHYAANGMSEALYVCTLLIGARYLARWTRGGELAALVVVAVSLAVAYLTRYESLAAAAGAAAVVALVSFGRATGEWRRRAGEAAADVVVVALPFVAAFLAWAGASWLIVGSPFETFSSAYGNAAQLGALGGVEAAARGPGYIVAQVLGLAPGIGLLALLAGGAGLLRRDPAFLGVIGVLGGGLAFSVAAFLAGVSFGWLRFLILTVPLATLLAGLALSRARPVAWPLPLGGRSGWLAGLAGWLVTGAAVIVLSVSALPRTVQTMLDRTLSRGDEAFQLQTVVANWGSPSRPALGWHVAGAAIARSIDALALPRGTVLVDVFDGFPIVVQSRRPEQFVITPDRDFNAVLADPAAFGVRYVLVPRPAGNTQLDAVGRRFPGAYADGTGLGTRIRDWTRPEFSWRLYEVGSASPLAPAPPIDRPLSQP